MKRFLLTLLLCLSTFSWASAKSSELPEIQLTKDNVAVLSGAVDSSSVSDVIQQLQKLDSSLKSKYPIYLFLYTPGGSIQDGLELIEFIKTVKRPVHTITLFAASMGFQIVQNAGNRYILQNGVLMSHKASGGFEGEFGDGMSQIDARYGLWMERILEMDQQTVVRTNGKQTLKSYRAAYQNELWRTGNKSVKEGYADRVVQASCSQDLQKEIRVVKLNFMGRTLRVEFSGCPLNQNVLSVSAEMNTNKGVMTHTEFLAKGGVFLKDLKDSGNYSPPDLYCIDPTMGIVDLRNQLVEAQKVAVTRQKQVIKGYY